VVPPDRACFKADAQPVRLAQGIRRA